MTPGLGKVRPGRGCSCLPDRKGAAGVRREPGWAAGKGPAGSDTVSPRSGDLDDLNNGGLKSWNCCLFRGEGAGNGAGVGPGSCLSLTAPALPGRSRRRIHRAPGSRVRSRPPQRGTLGIGSLFLPGGHWAPVCARRCFPRCRGWSQLLGIGKGCRVFLGWGRNLVLLRGAAPAPGIPAPPRSLLSQALPPQVALRHFGARLVCPGDFVWLLHAWKVPRDSKTQSKG